MAYLVAADLKTYLGISSSTDDTLLTALIAAAQKAIEEYTHHVFEMATATARTFDAIRDIGKGDDRRMLYLDTDLCTISSIANGDGTTVTAAQYVTEPRGVTPYYAIRLKASANVAWTYTDDPENAITVTGKWAYSATPPNDIVQATRRMAGWMYRGKDTQAYDSTAFSELGVIRIKHKIPEDILQLLDEPYRRLVG